MTPSLIEIQSHIGVAADGKWTPETARALAAALGMSASADQNTYKPYALTVRVMLELIAHEAIVRSAYYDSVNVLTWGVGVTSASGHSVERYRNNPQTIEKCLEIFVWLVREKYLPAVIRAFDGRDLTEAQLAAALSFHYNTGAIGRATWVKQFMAGQPTSAAKSFMNWRKPKEIIPRRQKERDLFFDGKWSNDGTALVYEVRSNLRPDFRSPNRVRIASDLESAMRA